MLIKPSDRVIGSSIGSIAYQIQLCDIHVADGHGLNTLRDLFKLHTFGTAILSKRHSGSEITSKTGPRLGFVPLPTTHGLVT